MKTDLEQLTDYQIFMVLDSGEDTPTDHQKVAYHMAFDVKSNLRHEARLFPVLIRL
jgi:hypothetical protein